jgi:V8-like Glu-specific endopeptidase
MGLEIERISNPLTYDRILRLRSLNPKEKAPSKVILNMDMLNLPAGSKASLVKIKGSVNSYKVRVSMPGSLSGKYLPLKKVPVKIPKIKKAAALSKIRGEIDSGHRLKHLKVNFIPQKIELRLNERPTPPFDFDYKQEREVLDVPINVFAPDDRYIYQDTSFPWRTVGRVDTPLGSCTGCTIGPRLLLTANHCIQWNSDNTAGWVRFRPGYYNGSAPLGEAWASTVISWTKVTPGDGLADEETAFDYVVCVLDTRIGDILGYPGYRVYSSDWNGGTYWQHMGYPSDLSGGERPSFQGDCVISTVGTESTAGQDGFVLGHFNDTVPGHSGGPVWGWWENEEWPRVVGVASAEAKIPAMDTSGDNEFGGGPGLSSLITWARDNYP